VLFTVNRFVWPREVQQWGMAHWRGVLGLKSEFALPLHLVTKVRLLILFGVMQTVPLVICCCLDGGNSPIQLCV
jgi:hypothetical protein